MVTDIKRAQIETTLGPKYILFGYIDPRVLTLRFYEIIGVKALSTCA